jgi:hypothetical protein
MTCRPTLGGLPYVGAMAMSRFATVLRLSTVALAAACWQVGNAQLDPSRKVTLSLPAARLANLLPKIGQELGVLMAPSGEVQDQVVLLDVKDATAEELMDRMAKTCCAVWTQLDDRYVLTRPNPMRIKLEADEIAERANTIRGSLERQSPEDKPFDATRADQLLAQFREYNDFIPATDGELATRYKKYLAINAALPTQRLLVRLLKTIPPETLAALPAGETSFALRPNRMQQPLGKGAEAAIATYLAEQGAWVSALAKMPEGGIANIRGEVWDPRAFGAKPNANAHFLVRVRTHRSVYRMLDTSLGIISSDGEFVTSANLRVEIRRPPPDPEPSLKPLATDNALAVFRPEILSLGQTQKYSWQQGAPVTFDRGLSEFLANPEKNDPLSLCWTDMFRSTCRAKGLNTLVWIDDRTFGMTLAVTPTYKPTVATATQWLLGQHTAKIEDGWLTARPSQPMESLEAVTSRVALGRVLRLVARDPLPSLDSLVSAIGAEPLQDLMVKPLWMAVQPMYGGIASNTLSRLDSLRFYGSLSPAMRQTLADGQEILLRNMTPTQRQALQDFMFRGAAGGRQLVRPQTPGAVYRPVTDEPSMIYPNGLPDDAVFSIQAVRQGYLFGLVNKKPDPYPPLFTPPQLAMRIQKRAGTGGNVPGDSDFDLYQPAWQWTIQLTLKPGTLVWTDYINIVVAGGPPAKLNKLPRVFQETIDAALQGGQGGRSKESSQRS